MIFVVNPISGSKHSKDSFDHSKNQEILNKLREIDPSCDHRNVIETTADGAWMKELKDKIQKKNFVATFGGDGTLMQVSSVLRGTDSVLLPIPSGRGNDWVKTLYPDLNIKEFWPWFAKKRFEKKQVDLAYFSDHSGTERSFLNMASLGYGGDIVEKAHNRKAIWSSSSFVYQIEGALALFETKEMTYNCPQLQGGSEFFGGFVGNGKANGSGLYWTKDANLEDGKIDVILFPKPSVLGMARSLGEVKKKKDPSFVFHRIQSEKIDLEFSEPCALELDGDFIGRFKTMLFRAQPKALWVMV
ncbi:MAG: diacylglycerol kinase family protein [Bacteriovoracia bacterium]